MGNCTEKGHWEILTICAGIVEEKSKYFVASIPKQSEGKGKSPDKKQAMNDRSAVRRAARLLNANFSSGDILLGLDYDNAHMARVEARAQRLMAASKDPDLIYVDFVRQAAEHELRLCIERVRRKLKGIELKYLAVTSDMDGDTGELVRIHHHLVIPNACLAAFREKWGKGRCKGKPIQQTDDLTQIAEYMLKQVRRVPDAKKYMPSRNLAKPTVRRRAAVGDAELRVPPGCKLIYRGGYEPGWSSQYIRYLRPRKC